MPRNTRPTPRRTPLVLASALGLALTAAMTLGSAGAASAHDALLSTTPADRATVATTPTSVVLHFEEPPVKIGMQVLITGPDGPAASGAPVLSGDDVTQAIDPAAGAGTFTVLWRVTSDDGHPVSGKFTFTASAAGTATPTQTATAAPTSAQPASDGSGGTSKAWWALLLLVLVPLGLLLRRRRTSPH